MFGFHHSHIDTVYDAPQVIAAHVQYGFHMFAVLGRQDFLRVGRRNGRDLVGVEDAGLHEGYAAVETDVAIVEQGSMEGRGRSRSFPVQSYPGRARLWIV